MDAIEALEATAARLRILHETAMDVYQRLAAVSAQAGMPLDEHDSHLHGVAEGMLISLDIVEQAIAKAKEGVPS